MQKYCEEAGIETSSISIVDEIAKHLKVHRFYSVPYELGFPLGPPGDFENQKNICRDALNLILKNNQ